MNIVKMFKRTAAMGMALATVMSCAAVSAGAADVQSKTVTANVYVAADDNTILGKTAYFTPATKWNPLDLPIFAGSDNAQMTVDGTTTTVEIPLTNHIFHFVSFPDGTMTYTDGDMTVKAEDTNADTFADKMTYTFANDSFKSGTKYRIEDCNCYASESTIVGDNAGEHQFAVTMKVG